jgi:hypothetical protein
VKPCVDVAVKAPAATTPNIVTGLTAGGDGVPCYRLNITPLLAPSVAHPIALSGGGDWNIEHVSCTSLGGLFSVCTPEQCRPVELSAL